MKYLLICLPLLLILIYLNRTYSYFYYNIGLTNLKSALSQKDYVVGTAKKGDKVLTYIALGDSLTSGVGSLSYTQTFPFILAQKLNQKSKQPVELIVLSQPGAKTKDLINNQLTDQNLKQADYITLLIGINDIHDLQSIDSFSKNFDEILSQLSKLKAKTIVFNLPYLGPSQSFLFPYQFLFDYQTYQYNQVISQITKKYNMPLVDLYSATKNYSAEKDFYSADFFHPTSKGYQFWAELISI